MGTPNVNTWRVVQTDNLNRESSSDTEMCSCPNEQIAKKIVTALRDQFCTHSGPYWYEAYPPGKELYVYDPT